MLDKLTKPNEGIKAEKRSGQWRALFVDVITQHVVYDEISAGQIDAEETAWLIDMIEKDDDYDANEIALLENLMQTATEIPMDLKFRLGMILSV
ncbi:hypothetical protein [Magnetofaba australis]|uniref:Uncharacterized protein n=1 Tax=Magnetofaba australis IT-1 TaxID=1434232 RepID=A0A1Y2K7N9_9PROT|nr:hypothetical protein [Magnetofaba australis]OSM04785.1 hypothetical protein MAIT1_02875 [Magnetofaba australis IT-1]